MPRPSPPPSSPSSPSSPSPSPSSFYETHASAPGAGMPARTASPGSASVSSTRCTATPTATPAPISTPAVTRLSLVTHTASASALPDRFEAAVSRRGGVVVLWSAATLWLLQTGQLPRLCARTLHVRRKPVAVAVTDDGALMAVLARPAQVDVYELGAVLTKRRTIALLHEATALSLSPDACILIAGNRLGIEVVAIGPGAPDTARRTLSGPPGHALEFADDGRTLLITAAAARVAHPSALVVLPGLYDGPLADNGEPLPQPPEAAWTTSVLFPAPVRPARQAVLLPDLATGAVHELLAFNPAERAWGIFDMATQRFTPPTLRLPDSDSDLDSHPARAEPAHDGLPAVSPRADLAAVAVNLHDTTSIAIYTLPDGGGDRGHHHHHHPPSEKAHHDAPVTPRFCIPVPRHDNDDVATLHEIAILRWVRLDTHVQRLVAVGHSRALPGASDVPGAPPGAKALLLVLDFDARHPPDSPAPTPVATEYDLDWMLPGETLPEGSIDFDREVELVRTRTLAQRRAAPDGADPTATKQTHRTAAFRPSHRPRLPSGDSEELTPEEAQALFEAPYDHQQPRSQLSLARAATVAAGSPVNRQHLRALPLRPLDYHRADGHRQPPHESDADNWVPPPPAYTPTADAAGSVSLSHPDAPPIPRSSRTVNRPLVPPVPVVPDLSATINPAQLSPSMPYQIPQPSSPSDHDDHHPAPPEWEQEHRPSLLHPSTYPGPQSQSQSYTMPNRGRRRSSATQSPSPPMSYMAAPVPHLADAPEASSRRPMLGLRRDVESSREARAPNTALNQWRTGSAPMLFTTATATHIPFSSPATTTVPYAYNGPPHAPSQPHYHFQHEYQQPHPRTQSCSNTVPHHPHALRTSPFTRSQPHLLLSGGSSSRLEPGREPIEASGTSGKKKKAECVVM